MKHYRLNEQNPIKTKRLLLTPLNEKELAQRIAEEPDELVRSAYNEMRRCVFAYPDQALWHNYWRITLRETKQTVGYFGFLGEPKDQTVELGFDLPEEFRELIGKMGIFNLVELDAARQERIMADEEEMLLFGLDWLELVFFGRQEHLRRKRHDI